MKLSEYPAHQVLVALLIRNEKDFETAARYGEVEGSHLIDLVRAARKKLTSVEKRLEGVKHE